MKIYTKSIVTSVLGVLLVVVLPAVVMSGEITSYSLNDKVMMDPACDLIKKKTGVTVSNLSMGGGELWTRVMSEKPNVQADMLIGANIEQAVNLKRMDMLLQYKSKAWDVVPADFKDSDGLYYCDAMWLVMPIVNTDLMKKKNLPMPTSWFDLLDPRWKGEIAMPNPMTSSSAYLTLLGLVRLFGEDQAFSYLKKLHPNVAQYTKSGGAPALLVARGEVAFGITDSSSTFSRLKEGFPIGIAVMKEGVPYSLNANLIFKNTKDPQRLADSKKVLDFLASEEYQLFATNFRPKVTNPNVVPAKINGVPEFVLIKSFDFEWAADNLKRLQDKWNKEFQTK
jgi:iron(III) transport system substrate-binding protein